MSTAVNKKVYRCHLINCYLLKLSQMVNERWAAVALK